MKIKGYGKYKPTLYLTLNIKDITNFTCPNQNTFLPLPNVPTTAFYMTHFLSFFSSLFKDDNE